MGRPQPQIHQMDQPRPQKGSLKKRANYWKLAKDTGQLGGLGKLPVEFAATGFLEPIRKLNNCHSCMQNLNNSPCALDQMSGVQNVARNFNEVLTRAYASMWVACARIHAITLTQQTYTA